MVEVEEVTFLLSVLTVFSDAFIFVFLILFIFFRDNMPKFIRPYWNFLKADGLKLGLLVAVVAMSGSLYYSEIALYEPCRLCWFQRIAMYPMVLLLAIAIWKNDHKVSNFTIPLAVIGGSISLYHVATNGLSISTGCDISGGIPCSIEFFKLFGFVTIPFMALTAFCLIIIFSFMSRR